MGGALHDRHALVLYGSETGNAQDVAEELGRLAERLRFDTEVAELNAIPLRQLLQCSVLLIAISTTGQGELPPNSQVFWKALRSTRLRPGCLQQLRFASFGLGDSSYPKFNWAHRKLYNRLVQLGAQPICDRGEADEQHPDGLDGAFAAWSPKLRQRLLEEFPLPDNVEPIPDDVLLEPKWLLDFEEQQANSDADSIVKAPPQDFQGTSEDRPPLDLLDIPHGITATVLTNNRLTPRAHWQDVRQLTLSLSGHHPYVPGDVLTIYPKNFPSDVEQFLEVTHWKAIADKPLKFTPSPKTASSPPSRPPLPHHSTEKPITLRTLLTDHLDIMSIPRRSFFAHLAYFTDDEFQKERLLEFTNPEYIDELYDYTTRPRRSILEVLQEFETVKIPWQRVCSIIPAMRGRQFSIASALPTSSTNQESTLVELLIAIVKYRTVIKRIRQGVCTRYVASLQPGQNITVTLAKGGLHVTEAEIDRPAVMIGPGTGVAPMRSLIYQRKYWRHDLDIGEEAPHDLLFFGCRNAGSDYFFKDEWEALTKEGVPLNVFAAFSRDQQREKVYVQDLVRTHSALVYDAVVNKGGFIYICGSSGKMPQAVREALIEGIQQHGDMDREGAEAYLAALEKSGRYRQETW
ncbi:riboflavin synthase domain-like protein, partial [Sporormia fimetaria CBS 119925]